MRLDDLPIRLKLPFTIGLGLFLFAGVVLFHTLNLRHTIAGYEHLLDHDLKIQQSARGVIIEMLQARRAEKDFLTRRDPALLEEVNRRVAQSIQSVREIQRLSVGQGIEAQVAQRMGLVDHLEGYRRLWMEIAADWRDKGLSHQEGRQGVFRQAARSLEEAMSRVETAERDAARDLQAETVTRLEAQVGYLSMRRMEKDYLLRQDPEAAAEVEKWAVVFGERLKKAIRHTGERERIDALLVEYRNAFRALVILDRGIEEKMTRLRAEIHRVEPLAEEIDALAARLAAEGSLETRRSAERSAQWIFIASLATILACGLISMRMVRVLVRSISALSHYARAVADGNLDARIDLNCGDETGHLAEVMRAMVNRMRAIRLIADRMVVILALIGRGAIPEPLDVAFHGDFKKIIEALNDLIDRLGALRRVAACMDLISRGDVPEKMTGEFQGDFKRIQEAMNSIIDTLQENGGLPVVVP
ncbi:MAG: HAMP domain-containing protein [Magnetococcales bacterium]|nr:HAMP domain-containing protein [Magnetococcales bacterium]